MRGHVPPLASLPRCEADCSAHGTCVPQRRAATGWTSACACAPGWRGASCATRAPSACNAPGGGRVLSRCAGHCDATRNRCVCGPGARFPNRSMQRCEFVGVEAQMAWRSPGWAGFTRAPREAFWGGAAAWCDAPPGGTPPRVRCACHEGQRASRLCEPLGAPSTSSLFCLNQCSARGECEGGYCRCARGSYGADCSGSTAGGAAAPPGGAFPRVYVYDLPGEFNTFLLSRRLDARSCVLRTYRPLAERGARAALGGTDGVGVEWADNLYGAEVALHEALLRSPHRTLDPEEAHFFFVPAYAGCFVSEFNRPYPAHWLCDECERGAAADLASLRAERWHARLLAHIRSRGYWDRSGGADHLWPFVHDEGACYAPRALRRATMLVHWGRTHWRPNGSSEYHLWRVRPHARRMYGWERCYDRCKDIVLPAWRRPDFFAASPHLLAAGATPPRREIFFYFNGALGLTPQFVNYSFGLRQQLHAIAQGLRGQGVIVTDQKTPDYSRNLAKSTFCGVLPGWGWSGRMEDAVLHGCIPVLMQDGVDAPWETWLDWRRYSVRIKREQMPNLFVTLRAIPAAQVSAMQSALQEVWPRFSYIGAYAAERARRAATVGANAPTRELEKHAQLDAVATLMELLAHRQRKLEARKRGENSPLAATTPGCADLPDGGEVSVAGDDTRAVFEGREVGGTGWVI
ncbi:hypothetical protein AB1Y20_009690 [Prymnesium parvum]|uniref:EGF-like domain-containing protein n=1 Tax=Prymnesium parvum TaxID=97485 RepID=A0AB34K272_PRYPA